MSNEKWKTNWSVNTFNFWRYREVVSVSLNVHSDVQYLYIDNISERSFSFSLYLSLSLSFSLSLSLTVFLSLLSLSLSLSLSLKVSYIQKVMVHLKKQYYKKKKKRRKYKKKKKEQKRCAIEQIGKRARTRNEKKGEQRTVIV